MTLQRRLTIILSAGVAAAIGCFQAIQFYQLQSGFRKVGVGNARILNESLSDTADNVERAMEFGISTALAAGDMDVFARVARLQKELHGLQEFSLYNEHGVVSYSSDPSRIKNVMGPELKQQLFAKPERVVRESAGQIDIYQPRLATKDCLQCHTDWKQDMVAGITLVKYSTKAVTEAQNQSLAVTHEAERNGLFLAVVTVIGSLVAVTGLVILSIRPVARRLAGVASGLEASSKHLAQSAAQLSGTAQSIAQGASEQAASLEETSSSLEEMSSSIKRNSESAAQANELAGRARNAAEKGASDMQEMSTAMDAIKVASDDVAKIIQTIDEIAFQTNLLALNAAVEAARAGEAGTGFSVVADEVRSLAQRCARAAKETSTQIAGAISKTGQGVELSAKVAKTLEEIVTRVRQVDKLVAEVASASQEQSQGISQINLAVSQMDQVTQNNAASAEESAGVAEELKAQAHAMKGSVEELVEEVMGKGTEQGQWAMGDGQRAMGHGQWPTGSLAEKWNNEHDSVRRAPATAPHNGEGERRLVPEVNRVSARLRTNY